ncbi:MAG: ABC transporter permease subunit [Hyphomicrobiales bacterium]|nr:MAG: ABC transporter permease subunit [Hyphomicrobiales bacterium]
MTLFFLVPLAVVFGISLSVKQFGQPPFTDLLTTDSGTVQLTLHLSNYLKLIEGSTLGPNFWTQIIVFLLVGFVAFRIGRAVAKHVEPVALWAIHAVAIVAIVLLIATLYTTEFNVYLTAFLSSIRFAAISTLFAVLIGYPMAYAIARAPDRWRNILLMLVILPFWTSFLLRVYALSGFMRGEGVINQLLGTVGIPPLVMLQTDFAVYVGIVYSYLPFFVLPLYTNLVKLDPSLLEASADLGARPFRTFLSVTLPLSMSGVIAGAMLVFIPAIGEFVIPSLLGGPGTQMIGRILWDEFFAKTNWPRAAALAVTLLVIVVIPFMLMQRAQDAVVAGR